MAIIGVDLGTSNSAAAVLRGGRPVIIPSAEGISLGGKAFPSYVAITADGQMLVGEPARRQAAVNPTGRRQPSSGRMGRRDTLRLRDKEFSPEQLSAFLLQKIKRDAEAFWGSRSRRRSSPCRPTSMTTSAAPPRTRADRRAGGRPPGQRANRRLPSLRPRPAWPGAAHRRDRPRRRHPRRDRHGVRQGRLRGEGDQRRHATRRHRHGPEDLRAPRRPVPPADGHRRPRDRRAASPPRGRRAGQDRADDQHHARISLPFLAAVAAPRPPGQI